MQTFRVYHHQRKGYRAVPVGFCWPAAGLGFLWAAANSLWGQAFILFLFTGGLIAAIVAGTLMNAQMLILGALAGLSMLPIWAGLQGNQWYYEALEKKGFRLVKRISASSVTAAINAAQRSQGQRERQTSSKEDQSNTTRFGRDFRDIRDGSKTPQQAPPPAERQPAWRRR